MGWEILAEDSSENRMVLSMLLKSHGFPQPSPQHSTSPYMNEPSVIRSCFSPHSNRKHRRSLLMQRELERGPGCVQGSSVGCWCWPSWIWGCPGHSCWEGAESSPAFPGKPQVKSQPCYEILENQ